MWPYGLQQLWIIVNSHTGLDSYALVSHLILSSPVQKGVRATDPSLSFGCPDFISHCPIHFTW